MGYFEIGIYHTKTAINVGTLWRSAWQLGASGVFTIGRRYKRQASDTVKVERSLPLRHYLGFKEFLANRPLGAMLIAVEMGGSPLAKFCHPKQAIYLLGAEDHGLPTAILDQCQATVSISAIRHDCYNVAVAGSILMWHRQFGGW